MGSDDKPQELTNRTNFFHFCILLLDVGNKVLREVFQHHYVAASRKSLREFLEYYKRKLSKLKSKIIKQENYDLLFPESGHPCLLNFDLALLCVLFQNLHHSRSAYDLVWTRKPPPGDVSLAADITRLRNIRDNYCDSYMDSPSMDSETFANVKAELLKVFSRLTNGLPAGQFSHSDLMDLIALELQSEFDFSREEVLLSRLGCWQREDISQQVDAQLGGLKTLRNKRQGQSTSPKTRPATTMTSVTKNTEVTTMMTFESRGLDVAASDEEAKRLSEHFEELTAQTEDILDAKRTFIPTSQTKAAMTALRTTGCVVLVGHSGNGKTANALYLLQEFSLPGRRLILHNSYDWRALNLEKMDLILIEDMAGRFDLDEGMFLKWNMHMEEIDTYVRNGKLRIVITISLTVMRHIWDKVKNYNIFMTESRVTLSSDELDKEEKKKIMHAILSSHSVDISSEEMVKCAETFMGKLGFPQSCHLFCIDDALFKRKHNFFKSPMEYFLYALERLEGTKLFALSVLFCSQGVIELDDGSLPENLQFIANDISRVFLGARISHRSVETILMAEFKRMAGTYLTTTETSISFSHDVIHEAVGLILSVRNCAVVIRYCSSDYLCQRVYVGEKISNGDNFVFASMMVCVPAKIYEVLIDRVYKEVTENRNVISMACLQAFRKIDFVENLSIVFQKRNIVHHFLTTNEFDTCHYCMHRNIVVKKFSGTLSCFLPALCVSPNVPPQPVWELLLMYLVCQHSVDERHTINCWGYKTKKAILTNALLFGHGQVASMVLQDIDPISIHLCCSVKNGNETFVKIVLERIIDLNLFDKEGRTERKALVHAYILSRQNLVDILEGAGVRLRMEDLNHIIKKGDVAVASKVITTLKKNGQFYPHSLDFYFHALKHAVRRDIWNLLLKESSIESLKKNMWTLEGQTLRYAIGVLKDEGIWDTKDDSIVHVLEQSFKLQNDVNWDILVAEGLRLPVESLVENISKDTRKDQLVAGIKLLKSSNIWNNYHPSLPKSVAYACISNRKDLLLALEEEGVVGTMELLEYAVSKRKSSIYLYMDHMIRCSIWDPRSVVAQRLIATACRKNDLDVVQALEKAGVVSSMPMLNDVISIPNLPHQRAKTYIEHMKSHNAWNPDSEYAQIAILIACKNMNKDLLSILEAEGAVGTMDLLQDAVEDSEMKHEQIRLYIEHLKRCSVFDPKCKEATSSLALACKQNNLKVLSILENEGVVGSMEQLEELVSNTSCGWRLLLFIKHMKRFKVWNPNSESAKKAIRIACKRNKSDCLVMLERAKARSSIDQMSHLISDYDNRDESVKMFIDHLQRHHIWDPKSDVAKDALNMAHARSWTTTETILKDNGVRPSTVCNIM
ncbi:hypothetical protein ACJMK2_026682 [Sinanodonta woodiana]|uniref:DZIP3-like HEPN domain-containing protein n=1 Tax=Sinanodonta woodiana TaxID=1069815 RepID=A0ABD3XNW3_SINWO